MSVVPASIFAFSRVEDHWHPGLGETPPNKNCSSEQTLEIGFAAPGPTPAGQVRQDINSNEIED